MNSDIINYHYDEVFPAPPSYFSFDETPSQESVFEDPLSEIVLSPSTDPAEDSSIGQSLPAADEKARDRKLRIKDKVNKAKAKYPARKKLMKKVSVADRKQVLLLRNRLSAQRSREKKKEELANLKEINEQLEISKREAESQLASVSAELESMRATVDLLSPESKEEFNRLYFGLVDPPAQRSKRRVSFLMAGALLGCICLVCCLAPFVLPQQTALVPRNRLLLESPAQNLCFPANLGECELGRGLKRSNSTELALYESGELFREEAHSTLYAHNTYMLDTPNNANITYSPR